MNEGEQQMTTKESELARDALRRLLQEMPTVLADGNRIWAWLFDEPPQSQGRTASQVVKRSSVLAVHHARGLNSALTLLMSRSPANGQATQTPRQSRSQV